MQRLTICLLALSLTMGVMYGAIEFYRKAKEESIKPIIGCEVYIIDGDISVKKAENSSNFSPGSSCKR